jgi:hypothetical protein
MIPWTETAAKIWEDFCRRTRENLRGSGADADEVVDDLRRHVEEEIRASKLSVVTEEDMRQILARVGEPAAAETAPQSGKKGRAAMDVSHLRACVRHPAAGGDASV